MGRDPDLICSSIESLVAAGFPLEYTRGASSVRLLVDAPRAGCVHGIPGWGEATTIFLANCGSTQEIVRAKIAGGTRLPILVLSESQTSGRGTHGRAWFTPPGAGLYFSLGLRPKLDYRYLHLLPLLLGVALAEAISAETGFEPTLKWKNDLLGPDTRKFGGVLVEPKYSPEGVLDHLIVGVGINVRSFSAAKELGASGLEEYSGPTSRHQLLNAILRAVDRHVTLAEASDPGAVLERWRRANSTIGRAVQVLGQEESPFEAVAVDIADDGALIVETSAGEHRRVYGRVLLVPPKPSGAVDVPMPHVRK